jgi:8-oxo-dGTP pyrophosphatase MutT (NUDIX family)
VFETASRPLTGSGALFLNAFGGVLVVEPTYKATWEIPGGVVEDGETPREACAREVLEELGLVVTPGPLLVVDWAPADGQGDRVLFVFDGGTLSAVQIGRMVLQESELASAEFIDPDAVPDRLIPRLARRVTAALDARRSGVTRYLEQGVPV